MPKKVSVELVGKVVHLNGYERIHVTVEDILRNVAFGFDLNPEDNGKIFLNDYVLFICDFSLNQRKSANTKTFVEFGDVNGFTKKYLHKKGWAYCESQLRNISTITNTQISSKILEVMNLMAKKGIEDVETAEKFVTLSDKLKEISLKNLEIVKSKEVTLV